jgi:hypothetical protein
MDFRAKDRKILLNGLSDIPQFRTVRERQTIILNALSGYPLSGEIDKALRFLDWEGAPVVVADNPLKSSHFPEPLAAQSFCAAASTENQLLGA